jgi:transcriptional regulator with XRE-family HTH domain
MPDLSITLPHEVCSELGQRVRARRLALNLPTHELAARVGVSEKTVRNLEQTGRCTLDTFVRVLEVLNALGDLQQVLVTQTRSIEAMRQQALAQAKPRQRASSPRRVKPLGGAA